MREIKFRGKQIDTLEWIYGYFTKTPEGLCKIHFQPFAECSSNTYFFVFPESVGQYTGLKDKNGKEVYEGDLLRDKISGVVWVVKFGHCKKYAFVGWFVENETIGRTTQLYGDYDTDVNSSVEIIGNIYESPIS